VFYFISQYKMTEQTQSDIDLYLTTLNEQQRKAYNIAKRHLGTSFDIARSNGYKEWLKAKK
jgi:hypothetical protein